jgi:hypothetical protein
MSENDTKKQEALNPPSEFRKLVDDFVNDISITFPEYRGIISKWWNRPSENIEIDRSRETLLVFRHCRKVFPERFFDILYKNVEIFSDDSDINTEFLPGIVFKHLWNLDISDTTKNTIWKYLQLLLFSVIGSVDNSEHLGDTAKLFEAIDEEELKKKIEETIEGMQTMFENDGEQTNTEIPNAQQIHHHIESMMSGKLGKLAMELAEETAEELNLDMENVTDAKDVFQKLFKNPGKMMNMVKNIGNKLDEKIKSGEIKESELMEEGKELLNKMKDMPGMGDMQKILSQMGLGKGAKVDFKGMEAQLNRNMKTAKLKERLKSRVEEKKANSNFSNVNVTQNEQPTVSQEEIIKIFSTGEKVDKTPRKQKAKKKVKK